MRLSSIILIISILFVFSGCHGKFSTYSNFVYNKDLAVATNMSLKGTKAYIKKDYNEEEYIYIAIPSYFYTVPKECVFGYIVKKDDPYQRAIRWKILSKKEYCKQHI